jgi:DNA-directed RNA polymerase specialized sigma24 family protein
MQCLITAAVNGDREALGELIQSVNPIIRGIVVVSVRSSDVNDVSQDVCVKIIRHIATVTSKDQATFRGWVRRITKRVVIEHYRKRRDSAELVESSNDHCEFEAIEARDLVSHLNEHDLAIVWRVWVDGCAIHETKIGNESRSVTWRRFDAAARRLKQHTLALAG